MQTPPLGKADEDLINGCWTSILDDCAIVQIKGTLHIKRLNAAIAFAYGFAAQHDSRTLIFDASSLVGQPSLTDRFDISVQFAEAMRSAQSGLRLVLCLREDQRDPERFGLTVARNRGLNPDITNTLQEALTCIGISFLVPDIKWTEVEVSG